MNPIPKSLQDLQSVHVPLNDADFIKRFTTNDELVLQVKLAKSVLKIQKEEQERIKNLKAVHYA